MMLRTKDPTVTILPATRCEWCGAKHPREQLCAGRPSRRTFLFLFSAAIVGAVLPASAESMSYVSSKDADKYIMGVLRRGFVTVPINFSDRILGFALSAAQPGETVRVMLSSQDFVRMRVSEIVQPGDYITTGPNGCARPVKSKVLS
jgi:hypothetical protein